LDSNGYTVFYYENGRIASEGSFKHGLPDGLWKSYYEDGTIKSMGNKNLGKSEGYWTFFDSEGRKKFVYDFTADKKKWLCEFLRYAWECSQRDLLFG
jgi:antitoxin component YwqK of YwqJK toxin-antitoxin module